MKQQFFIFFLMLFFSACVEEEDLTIGGMQPAYISYDDLLHFDQLPPQPIVNAGKLMIYNNYLFLNEINKGVHVIDISDTLNPQKIYFLDIPGNKDIVAQNSLLYADNGPHLLTLDISNINQVTLVSRQMNAFHPSEYFPPDYAGYFECADYSKGWLISWHTAVLTNPACKK
jgi:hypothetical protein